MAAGNADRIPADLFEAHRTRLRAVAYRMLGSLAEAEDAVQETWVRLSRSDPAEIENLGGWLTTVVGRICLNVLRSRRTRGEDPLDLHFPDPVVTGAGATDPEREALFADGVGLAMMVVLEELQPAERLAFVLHDIFEVPFGEIAAISERTPAAVRQSASRARRRVQDATPGPDAELPAQRRAVDAFFAAAREGDFEALVAVLDPAVVIRSAGGTARPSLTAVIRGATEVASRALTYRNLSPFVHPVLVNGAAGVVVVPDHAPFSVMAFTVRGGRIVEIDVLGDPERLPRLVDPALAAS